MTSTPFRGIPFSHGPLTNITPFTYKDGLTYLAVLNSIKDYISGPLANEINTIIDSLDDRLITNQSELNAALSEFIETVESRFSGLAANAARVAVDSYLAQSSTLDSANTRLLNRDSSTRNSVVEIVNTETVDISSDLTTWKEGENNRLASKVPPIARQVMSEYVSDMDSVADAAAARALSTAGVISFSTIPEGSNLNNFTNNGEYGILSAAIAGTILNRPSDPNASQAANLKVYSANISGSVTIQRWQIVPSHNSRAVSWERHLSSTGSWSRWTATDGGAFELSTGANVKTLPVGKYSAGTFSVASSLINKPDDPAAWQAMTLDIEGDSQGQPRTVTWRVAPTAADDPLIWYMHRDNGGNWSRWYESGETRTLKGTENILGLRPGRYLVPTFGVASTLGNKPTGAYAYGQNPSYIDVIGSISQARMVRLETIPNSLEKSRVLVRHRDNSGVWSEWYDPASVNIPTGEDSLSIVATPFSVNHSALQNAYASIVADDHPGKWKANAGNPVTVTTPDGTGQVTHPKVVDTGDFGGHRYWMAATPYAFSNDALENPYIWYSDDGNSWSLSNNGEALDVQPGSPGYYNSDTHLVINGGTLYVVWRTSRTSPGTSDTISWRSTTDGVTWTPKHVLYTSGDPGTVYGQMLSPVLMRHGSGWRMYLVAANADPNRLVYVESDVAVPGPADWSAPVRCTLNGGDQFIANRDVWHIDIDNSGSWVALLNDCEQRTGGNNGDIYLAVSSDGVNWTVSMSPLIPRYSKNHNSLYRASIVNSDSASIDIIYSARVAESQKWGLYRAKATK